MPVIQSRHLWRETNLHPQKLSVPTRSFDDSRGDTIVRTVHGDLHCICPDSGEMRPMTYQGREQQRGTLKWACPASVNDFECTGRQECHRLGGVADGARTRIVRTRIDPDHLRSHGALPPGTLKFRRLYRQRSALERINSRVADSFGMAEHYICGYRQLHLRVSLSMTVMLAAACSAIECGQPHRMRSLTRALAA